MLIRSLLLHLLTFLTNKLTDIDLNRFTYPPPDRQFLTIPDPPLLSKYRPTFILARTPL